MGDRSSGHFSLWSWAENAGQSVLDRGGDAISWASDRWQRQFPDRAKIRTQVSINEVIDAAHSGHPIDAFMAGNQPATQADDPTTSRRLQRLSSQFEQTFQGLPGFHAAHSPNPFKWPWAQWSDDISDNTKQLMRQARLHALGGSENNANDVLARNDVQGIYDRLRNDPSLRNDPVIRQHLVPLDLVEAIIYVENRYNPGSLPLDNTALPMNINSRMWERAFESYNRAHPQAPINDHTIHESLFTGRTRNDRNITAGIIILSTINAAIDPAITGDERWALVASMYGNTEVTLEAGRPIMYGGKVATVMQERYPQPARRAAAAITPPDTEQALSNANLMGLRPLGPVAPAAVPVRAAGL